MKVRGWTAIALLTGGVAQAQDATAPLTSPPTEPTTPAVPDAAPVDAAQPDAAQPDAAQPDAEQPVLDAADPTAEADLEARVRAVEHQVDLALGDVPSPRSPADLSPPTGGHFHGYASGGLVGWSKEQPFGFEIGELVLGYEAPLGRSATAHADLAFLDGSRTAMEFVDRLELDVKISEHMTLRVGKLYTPLGYWNTNLPIESFDVITRDRPEILTRDAAAFATRQGGVDLAGRYVLGSSQLGWRLGAGNGRSYDLNTTAAVLDAAPGKSAWAALWLQSPRGLQLGVSGSYDPIRPPPGTEEAPGVVATSIDEIVLTGHLAILRPHTEIIGEAFVILHSAPNEPAVYNRSAYLQVSHQTRKLTPYLRVEYVEKWADDPLYILQRDTYSAVDAVVGGRHDLSQHLAVKGEVLAEQAIAYGVGPSVSSLRLGAGLQLAATF